MRLTDISTKDLVAELSKREGVSVEIAKPYQGKTVTVNGSAIILTVVD